MGAQNQQPGPLSGPVAWLAPNLGHSGGQHRRVRVQSPHRVGIPQITTATHLRHVLGEPSYESLARKGETMTTAAMVTYAFDQIDQARTELEHCREIDEI
jgi:hypothetical protein